MILCSSPSFDLSAPLSQVSDTNEETSRSLNILANGIVLFEEKNRKALDIGKDLLEAIVGEENAKMLVDVGRSHKEEAAA